jgi:septal ring factor EnvC (AmiA/AmiB activator)
MLTKKDKNDIKDIVVDVLEDVIMPAFETVATKTDLKKVETRLDGVETRLDGVETRLDGVETRLETVDRKLDRIVDEHLTHEKRIKNLETRRAIT